MKHYLLALLMLALLLPLSACADTKAEAPLPEEQPPLIEITPLEAELTLADEIWRYVDGSTSMDLLDLSSCAYLNDFAKLLSRQTKEYIIQSGNFFAEKIGCPQVMVLTVNSLEGKKIADYASQIGEEWSIGGPKMKRGILILLAEKENEIYVELGSGVFHKIKENWAGCVLSMDEVVRYGQGRYVPHAPRGMGVGIRIYVDYTGEADNFDRCFSVLYSDIMDTAEKTYGIYLVSRILLILAAIICFIIIMEILAIRNRHRNGKPIFSSHPELDLIMWPGVKKNSVPRSKW